MNMLRWIWVVAALLAQGPAAADPTKVPNNDHLWTQLTGPARTRDASRGMYTVENNFRALASNGLRVVLGGSHGILASSDDSGQTWRSATLSRSLENAHVTDIAHAGGTWIAVTGVPGQVLSGAPQNRTVFALRSTDGAGWTVTPGVLGGSTQNTLMAVAGDGQGRWVAGSYFGRVITSADDGRSWTTRTPAPTDVTVSGVAWFNGRFYAAHHNRATGGSRIISSADGGATWSPGAQLAFNTDAMKVLNGRLFAMGDRNGVASTANGTAWTTHQISAPTRRLSVDAGVYTSSKGYTFLGEAGIILQSRTLATWVEGSLPLDQYAMDAVPVPSNPNRLLVVTTNYGLLMGTPRL